MEQDKDLDIRNLLKLETISEETGFNFLGNLAGSGSSTSTETESDEYADLSVGVEEKKKRLAKRLIDMTSKIEDLTNQIYHLQQRIELLEKKLEVRG